MSGPDPAVAAVRGAVAAAWPTCRTARWCWSPAAAAPTRSRWRRPWRSWPGRRTAPRPDAGCGPARWWSTTAGTRGRRRWPNEPRPPVATSAWTRSRCWSPRTARHGAPRCRRAGPPVPEADARRVRYALLDAAAARSGAVAVLLGHTLDDQAETVLLGTGPGVGRTVAGRDAGPARRLPPSAAGLTRDQTRRRRAGARPAGVGRPGEHRPRLHPCPAAPRHADPDQTRWARACPALWPAPASCCAEDADVPGPPGRRAARRGPGRWTPGPSRCPDCGSTSRCWRPRPRRCAAGPCCTPPGRPAPRPGAVGRTHVLALDALVTGWRGQGPVQPARAGDRHAGLWQACARPAGPAARRRPRGATWKPVTWATTWPPS